MKQCNHLGCPVRHDQGVRLPWRFEDIVSGASSPGVLKIAPRSLKRECVHWTYVPMARENARALHSQNVDVIALCNIQQNRTEGDARRLRNPYSRGRDAQGTLQVKFGSKQRSSDPPGCEEGRSLEGSAMESYLGWLGQLKQ
jgi:hypothetical protein